MRKIGLLAMGVSVIAVSLGAYAIYSRRTPWTMPPQGPTTQAHPEVLHLQASFSNVSELVKPSVVSISTVRTEEQSAPFALGDPMERFFDEFFGAPPGNRREGTAPKRRKPKTFRAEGVGSGVIIDAEGMVLTNEHVLRDAEQIKVFLYDGEGNKKEYKGTVIGKDARTDLAVVRIHAGRALPFAALGDSDHVKIGDWAIAIGSPFGLSQTVTVGVISAARQSLVIEDKEYRNLIQTDAAINRGNSGGPLLNIRGEVVGINSAIYAPTGVFSGVGFAVPINQAKAILKELVKTGKVTRGWLGVELGREITPAMVKHFGLPDEQGALVNEVMKDTPAQKAGLKRGDVVRKFGGKPVKSAAQLQTVVADTPPGKSVPLEVIRDRKTLTLTLITGERPESVDTRASRAADQEGSGDKPEQQDWLGASVLTLTPDLANSFRQPDDARGVVVTNVESRSIAEEMGLLPGDVIRLVNRTPTPQVDTFRKVTQALNLNDGVVLDVLRQGKAIYLSYSKQ